MFTDSRALNTSSHAAS